MEIYATLLLMTMLWYGYVKQIIKLVKQKNANGVSYQAFLLGALAGFSVFFQSEDVYIKFIYFVAALFCILLTYLIIHYQRKSNYKTSENYVSLSISAIFSFFGIYGVAQVIKLYHYKFKEPIMVDTTSYFVWGSGYLFGVFFFSKEPSVIAVSIISSILMFGIVCYVYIYNKRLNSP